MPLLSFVSDKLRPGVRPGIRSGIESMPARRTTMDISPDSTLAAAAGVSLSQTLRSLG